MQVFGTRLYGYSIAYSIFESLKLSGLVPMSSVENGVLEAPEAPEPKSIAQPEGG